MMITLADRLAATDGKPSGFDYMRISLALAVFTYHCFGASYPHSSFSTYYNSALKPLTSFIVPMFFALSGFLVAGSLERSRTIVNFLGLRIIRIFPALVVETILSALLLGPLLTTTSISAYFQSPVFYKYLLNVVGYIHYYLPGVFEHHEITKVNIQLWTVPFEFECYAALAALAVLGIARQRTGLLIIVLCAQFIWGVHHAMAHNFSHGILDFNNVDGRSLVFGFLFGVIMYLYRDRLPWSGKIALVCGILSWLLLEEPFASSFVGLPISYVVAYLGLMSPKRNVLVTSGDYSYGIYLFSFPIQQVIIGFGAWSHRWWILFIIGLPCSCLFAAASWHLVEKHALMIRPVLKRFEGRYIAMRDQAFHTYRLHPRLLQGLRFVKSLSSRRPIR